MRTLRDFDGDGVRDLGVSTPQYSYLCDFNPQAPSGWAQVLSGVNGAELWARVGTAENEGFGAFLEPLDDFDGDGRPELFANCADPSGAQYSFGTGLFSSRAGYATPQHYCASAFNLDWTGSTSVAANALRLVVKNLPPNSVGTFFFGRRAVGGTTGYTSCVLGPGLRVAATVVADAVGNASFTLHASSTALLAPGTTWNFQFVFPNLITSGELKFSDALAVTFTP